jgi:hypothetical protein
MTKFRKKSNTVEAFQLTDEIIRGEVQAPQWFVDAVDGYTIGTVTIDRGYTRLFTIQTPEGATLVGKDDWIIRGVDGRFSCCKPEVFEDNYAPHTEEPPTDQPIAFWSWGAKRMFGWLKSSV